MNLNWLTLRAQSGRKVEWKATRKLGEQGPAGIPADSQKRFAQREPYSRGRSKRSCNGGFFSRRWKESIGAAAAASRCPGRMRFSREKQAVAQQFAICKRAPAAFVDRGRGEWRANWKMSVRRLPVTGARSAGRAPAFQPPEFRLRCSDLRYGDRLHPGSGAPSSFFLISSGAEWINRTQWDRLEDRIWIRAKSRVIRRFLLTHCR